MSGMDAAVKRMMNVGIDTGLRDLSIGQPDIPIPDDIIEAGIKAMRGGRNGYTMKNGMPELVERIAQCNPGVDAQDVIITAGGSEAVAIAIESVCAPGGTVIMPDPAWPNYRTLCESLGIGMVPYSVGGVGTPFFDMDAIEDGLKGGAKLIIANSPANPSGAVATEDELRALYEMAEKYDAYIISDEAYRHIVFDGGTCAPSLFDFDVTQDSDDKRRVFVVRTFSKIFCMTGMRLGYLIVPPSRMVRASVLHGSTVGCAPAGAQIMGIKALDYLDREQKKLAALYKSRFELAKLILGDLMPTQDIDHMGAFYLWITSPTGVDADELVRRMRAKGVIVSSGDAYSFYPTHSVRISLTAPENVLTDVFTSLREALLEPVGAGSDALADA